MSGTSSHPHMAGEAAVLRQYLKETYPNLSDFELGELANSLLMSTAVSLLDNGSGTISPPSAARAQAWPMCIMPSCPARTSA